MIYKSFSLKLLFSQNRKEILSFCSFLASISPGASANFSCSPHKSSGVVFSFKTLTSFFRPSTLGYYVLHQTQLVFAPASLSSRTLITPCPLFILSKSSEIPLLGQRSCFRQKEQILSFVQIRIAQAASVIPVLKGRS